MNRCVHRSTLLIKLIYSATQEWNHVPTGYEVILRKVRQIKLNTIHLSVLSLIPVQLIVSLVGSIIAKKVSQSGRGRHGAVSSGDAVEG